MSRATRRGAKEGLEFGLIAGAIMLLFWVIGSALMLHEPFRPFRMFSSIVIGHSALTATSAGTATIVGLIVHFVLSGIFGVIYGAINGTFSTATETSFGRQTALGLLYGAILWFVNFQIIARVGYPWFLDSPQFMQFVLHAVFYGLPLGLMYSASERHSQHLSKLARMVA